MKSFFCIDLQRFMLIPTKFPLSPYRPCLVTYVFCFVAIIISNMGDGTVYYNLTFYTKKSLMTNLGL